MAEELEEMMAQTGFSLADTLQDSEEMIGVLTANWDDQMAENILANTVTTRARPIRGQLLACDVPVKQMHMQALVLLIGLSQLSCVTLPLACGCHYLCDSSANKEGLSISGCHVAPLLLSWCRSEPDRVRVMTGPAAATA